MIKPVRFLEFVMALVPSSFTRHLRPPLSTLYIWFALLLITLLFHFLQPPVYTSRFTSSLNVAAVISMRSEVPIPLLDSRSVPHI